MTLTTSDMMVIETRVASEGPSPAVAYLFWFFLWPVSGHRFYLGRPGSALLQIISYFVLVGFIWLLIDVFLINGMIQKRREELRQRLIAQTVTRAP
jgi:hypothetical protein